MLSPLLLTALLAGFVTVDAAGLDLPSAEVRAQRAELIALLLEAGHAITPDPLQQATRLRLIGPTVDSVVLIQGEVPTPWTVELHDDALSRRNLLARLGPPKARGPGQPAVAIAIAAWDPELEALLASSIPVAVLDASIPITGHRQAHDPRVCVAADAREVRLSAAMPGASCGRVLGHLKQPASLDRATLVAALESAVIQLAAEVHERTLDARAPATEQPPDDAGVLDEVFAKTAADRAPAKVGSLQDGVDWGWHLLIPDDVVLGGSAGLLARPPRLDPVGQLELRVLFPLGITLGLLTRVMFNGSISHPVVEGSALFGVGYEHVAGFGWTLRAGLYAGPRAHAWSGPYSGAMLDPVVAVVVGARYRLMPSLDLDLSLPLSGAPARGHLLDDDVTWSRRELGIGLNIGLAYAWELPF